METIYGVMNKEWTSKGLVEIPHLIERMTASIGSHIMNLYNIDTYDNPQTRKDAFFDAGELENFRLHVVMMAPAGYGKSTVFKFALQPTRGILREVKYLNTSMRGTFSPESWAGTATANKSTGEINMKSGVFSRFKRGIVGADEFMRFIGMMDTKSVNDYSNEEVYLLTGLDSDTITKDLSVAEIEETGIGTTLWAGSRITSLDMRHGLARRVLFQIFTPTPNICKQFKESGRNPKKRECISDYSASDINNSIIKVLTDLEKIKSFDYTEINNYMNKYPNLPHFEELLIRRIAVGFSIARNTLPNIVMDETLIGLIEDEIQNRTIIRGNPEHEIIYRVLKEQGEMKIKDLKSFLSHWYQFTDEHIQQLLKNMAQRQRIVKDNKNVSLAKRI